MASFTKFNSFVEAVAEKVHDLGADTLKVLLTNVAPVATNSVKADLTEITPGNGYVAGGNQAVQSSSSQTGGLYTLDCNDVVFTASGGAIGPFRYAVIYNDTASNDELIGWWDNSSAVTLNDTETFTVGLPSGVLTLQ